MIALAIAGLRGDARWLLSTTGRAVASLVLLDAVLVLGVATLQ